MNLRFVDPEISVETWPAGPTPGERLLLESLRRWAACRLAGAGPHGAVSGLIAWRTTSHVAGLFMAWMQAVEAVRLRPIQIHCQNCSGASPDEHRLIGAVGLAPIDMERGERLLAPLLRDPATVMVLARALNAALTTSGLPVSARLSSEPLSEEEFELTVH